MVMSRILSLPHLGLGLVVDLCHSYSGNGEPLRRKNFSKDLYGVVRPVLSRSYWTDSQLLMLHFSCDGSVLQVEVSLLDWLPARGAFWGYIVPSLALVESAL